MTTLFGKTKKEMCVGELLNGIIVVGEAPDKESNEFKKGDYIKNPIQVEFMPDPNGGIGFKSALVGNQLIAKKSASLEGVPVIQNFELTPLLVEMFISLHKLDKIQYGDAFLQVYNEIMSKMPEPVDPAKLAEKIQNSKLIGIEK